MSGPIGAYLLRNPEQAAHNESKEKVCTRCKRCLPISQFPRDKQKRDGLYSHCGDCNRERARKWADANMEKVKRRTAAWKEANPERAKENDARWRRENKDRKRDNDAQWRKENRHLVRLHSSARRARERAAKGHVSTDIVQKLHRLQKGKCPCCNQPLGEDFHLDHITPLVDGGAHEDSNLQLLRATCNLQKNRKDPVVFMQERGFLL